MRTIRTKASGIAAQFPFWLGLACVFLTGCDRRTDADPHVLGQIAPLSGPQRDRGVAGVRGVQLAVQETNSNPELIVAGRKIVVIHADGKGEAAITAGQAVRLITVNRVEGLIAGESRADTERITPVAREYAVPFVGSAGSVGSPPCTIALSLGLSPLDQLRVVETFLDESIKPESLTVVYDGRTALWVGMGELLVRRAKERKQAVTGHAYFSDAELNEMQKVLKGTSGAAVFVGGVADFLKMQPETACPTVFLGDAAEHSELAAHGKGVYFVSAYAPVGSPAFLEFATSYRKQFGDEPTMEAAAAYDSTRLLIGVAREAKSFLGSKLKSKMLETKTFDGLMGRVEFGKDLVASGPGFILQAKNGQTTIVQTVAPATTAK